jgi:hypothetical protein
MTDSEKNPGRRAFFGNALKLSAGSLLLGSSLPVAAGGGKTSSPLAALPKLPNCVLIEHKDNQLKTTERQGSRFSSDRAVVTLADSAASQEVRVACPNGPLSRVVLRWEMTFPSDTIYLGDHWERGYGDLQWRFLQPDRILPWYFAAHQSASGRTFR